MGMAFKGLAKLSEECGEVVQVCGKAIGVGSLEAGHWSGELKFMLELEMADVMAAILYVIEENKLDEKEIALRSGQKLALFRKWRDE